MIFVNINFHDILFKMLSLEDRVYLWSSHVIQKYLKKNIYASILYTNIQIYLQNYVHYAT